MLPMYLYQRLNWPTFIWDEAQINSRLLTIVYQQGIINGKMKSLGFQTQEKALLEILTTEVIKSADIEGEHMNTEEVRSSVARHLGIDLGGVLPADRHIDGIVEMLLDATQNYQKPLSIKRLCQWNSWLFPSSINGLMLINAGSLRNDSEGPMQVVSGTYGREKIHFRAPNSKELMAELTMFIKWFNNEQALVSPIIKAGIAHLWLITLHPFDDGNGRIARALIDMALAKSENNSSRFYSMSSQIRKDRKNYYDILEKSQKGSLDITEWLIWFLECLDQGMSQSELILEHVLNKAKFWEKHSNSLFNQRQVEMLNRLFDGFSGKLTSSKWAKITKCSQDTASRDINALIKDKVLKKDLVGGRSSNYLLAEFKINQLS